MFYKMIEAKRNEWLASETCTVKAVIDYIVKTGQMRDAQVEAIKTYLFLKIACVNCTQNIGQIRGIQAIDCIFSR